MVQLSLQLVLQAGLSLHGTANALALVAAHWQLRLELPCYSTIRSWLLRVGYYALQRPLPKADDWFWLVDHSIQIGATKLLVVVGGRLSQVPFADRCLRLTDLTLLTMVPMDGSTGDRVYKHLEQTVARTGVPRVLVSDLAGDLQRASNLFGQHYPTTHHVHDAAHHGANILEHRWSGQASWQAFLEQFRHTNSNLRQSRDAYLLSPTIRYKARFMNVAPLLRFASWVLRQLARPECAPALRQRYEWLESYRTTLAVWQAEHARVQELITWVRQHGLERATHRYFTQQWAASPAPETQAVTNDLLAYLSRYTVGLRDDEIVVASTEALESCFGKFKH